MAARHIILFLGFVLILVLPSIDQVAGISASLFPSTEKRQLAEMPKFKLSRFASFVEDYDVYYKDNFGLRNILMDGYSSWKYYGLGVSPLPQKFVRGKDGWMFLGNDFERVIDKTTGEDLFTGPDLVAIGKNVQRVRDELQAAGIALYIVIVPNKHTVYNKYLPKYMQTRPRSTKLEQVKTYLQGKHGVEVIDLKDNFPDVAGSSPLYYKGDSHWTFEGAFLGYQYLMQEIKTDFPNLHILNKEQLITEPVEGKKGTAHLIRLNTNEMGVRMSSAFPYVSVPDPPRQRVPTAYTGNPEEYEIRFIKPAPSAGPKVIVFRDSFSRALIPFIRESFGESAFFWVPCVRKSLVRAEQPDIVIWELGERRVDYLRVYCE